MDLLNQVVDYLNSHPEDIVALSGLLSLLIQYGINHVRGFSKFTNAILGLVAIPGVVTAGAAFSTSLHATAFPVVVVVAQLLYHSYEALKRNVATQSVEAPVVSSALVADPVPQPTESGY